MYRQTVSEITRELQTADETAFAALERSLADDSRKGVRAAVESAGRRLAAEAAERDRLGRMYTFEQKLATEHGAKCIVGLDEVGRGPLAGPLCVAAVVLDAQDDARIDGLNDSKQISPDRRELIAECIKKRAVAWNTQCISPDEIDGVGMMACLKTAFRRAVAQVEKTGVVPDIILLDGNPLHLDKREVNVVKGDAQCASVAAASIIAKVERDALMVALSREYPAYHFDSNKGYASAEHITAIKTYGLTPVHRATFCTSFTQPTLL